MGAKTEGTKVVEETKVAEETQVMDAAETVEEVIEIPASKAPVFKAGKGLKDIING